jgi:hypothetical protein
MSEECWLVTFIRSAYMSVPETRYTCAVVAKSASAAEAAVLRVEDYRSTGRVKVVRIEHVADRVIVVQEAR